MQPCSDHALIAQIKKGDILAFELLVKRYQRKLYYFVLRIIANDQDAQEIVQDTLLDVYRTIERVDQSRKFSTYLFVIAKNNAISRLRRKRQAVPLDENIVTEFANTSS